VEVDFQPGVLVAADDDAGAVGVEEEDGRVRVGPLQEVVLDGEVEVGVGRGGAVDLQAAVEMLGVTPCLCVRCGCEV
jgi:hypothetical protein